MIRNQQGFTIIELIIVVVIAAVLVAIAVPNMAVFIKNNARATRVNTMVTSLNFARNQAVSRNTRVSMCRSNAAFDDCAGVGTGEFATGWIVFTDAALPRGVVDAGAGDTVLRIFQPDMGGNATLRGRSGGPAGADIGGVSYRSNGLPEDLAAPGTLLTPDTIFNYCDDRGAPEARAVVVSTTGHLRLTRDTNGDGTDDMVIATVVTSLVCP